jgi:hypothetical protein
MLDITNMDFFCAREVNARVHSLGCAVRDWWTADAASEIMVTVPAFGVAKETIFFPPIVATIWNFCRIVLDLFCAHDSAVRHSTGAIRRADAACNVVEA